MIITVTDKINAVKKVNRDIPSATIFTGSISDYPDILFIKLGDTIHSLSNLKVGQSWPHLACEVRNYKVVNSIEFNLLS